MVNARVLRVWGQRAGWSLLIWSVAVTSAWAMEAGAYLHLAESMKAGAAESPKQIEQIAQYLAVLGTVITLLGGAMSVLPKVAESISLGARRKRALDRVESLAELMTKIKSDNLLSESMRNSVGAQIEAEIAEALEGLQANRVRRQRAHEARASNEHYDLTATQRAFLWYQPHGFWGWLAHLLAFAVPVAGLLLLLMDIAVSDTLADELPFIGTILVCVMIWWLPFRAWALHQRRGWRAVHPSPVASATA